jgi:hypothetical protein
MLLLSIPKVDDIEDLRGCKSLVSLTLNLPSSSVSSLDALKDLKGVTTLSLDLRRNSSVSSLDALKDLKGLTTLTLNLSNSNSNSSSISSLDALKLEGLTTLTLNLSNSSSVSSLDPLKNLKGLTTLTLDLGNSVSSLDALKNLNGLTTLTLDFGYSSVSSLDALKDLKGLTTLTLDLGNSVSSLDALKDLKGATTLSFDLRRNSSVSSLDALKDLKGLTTLTLDLGNSVSSLDALKDLKGLTTLSLDLRRNSSVSSLDALKDLKFQSGRSLISSKQREARNADDNSSATLPIPYTPKIASRAHPVRWLFGLANPPGQQPIHSDELRGVPLLVGPPPSPGNLHDPAGTAPDREDRIEPRPNLLLELLVPNTFARWKLGLCYNNLLCRVRIAPAHRRIRVEPCIATGCFGKGASHAESCLRDRRRLSLSRRL